MKTSNKILISILLVAFSTVIMSHILLRNKYLRGDFLTGQEADKFFRQEYTLKQPSFIKIKRLRACVFQYGKTPKLSVEKGPFNNITYSYLGDTLVVEGDSLGGKWAEPGVYLQLPNFPSAEAKECNLFLLGKKDSIQPAGFSITLLDAHLFTRMQFRDTTVFRFFDTLKVTAKNNSDITLYSKDNFNQLNIHLEHAVFQDRNAGIKDLQLEADSNSTVIATGRNLRWLRK